MHVILVSPERGVAEYTAKMDMKDASIGIE
jgi:hypothetical protein